MPVVYSIPSELNDLSVDVALTSPARGDVLYHGAAKWHNLPTGTAGQVLTAHGAGTDPTWTTLATADLSTAVILAPATDVHNVIVPTLDTVVPLAVKRHSATQSDDLFQAQDESGAAFVSLAPNGQVTIKAQTAGANCLRLEGHVGGPIMRCLDSGGANELFAVYYPGSGLSFVAQAATAGDIPFQIYTGPGNTSQVMQLYAFDADFNFTSQTNFNYDGSIQLYAFTSNLANTVEQARVVPAWADATDGSQKGRLSLQVSDSMTSREFLRGEANGAAAKIGFLGAAAVVRQTLAAAATNAATTQTLANDLRTALINLGLAA